MSKINYEEDRVQSITQADSAKSLSDKVIELKNLEDEIENAEESVSKLKEKAPDARLLHTYIRYTACKSSSFLLSKISLCRK